MPTPFHHGIGGVVSADIAVPDQEREVAFYAKVLTTGPAPLWRNDLMNNRGTPIIGLGERVPTYDALPLQWMPHVQVADVAASAARTIELGGRELMHGRDDDGHSEWAVLVDPFGAAFGVIPALPDAAPDAPGPEGTGHIAGLSLAAADVAAACAFYEEVVGWSAAPADPDGAHEMRRADGVAAAAIAPDEAIPSVWLLHLPVDDLDASLRHVREGGGEVLRKAADARSAVIRDPVGVHFALCAPG